VVFDISEDEKPILDTKEGLGNGYDEKSVPLTLRGEGVVHAYTYFATHIDASLRPYEWYKYHVLHGAKENGLPEEYIRTINSIESIEDPDKKRHKLEMGIYC
jgi:hypothetical protein